MSVGISNLIESSDIQSSESALHSLLGDVVCDTQILIKITRESQLIVCLVDCIQQIYDNHKYVDAASIANEAWRARNGFRIASANEDCIQGSLNIASHQLDCISVYLMIRVLEY